VSRLHKLIYYWFPVFIYCLLIFIQSAYPSPGQIPAWPFFDKFLHVAAYTIMGALFLRAFGTTRIKHNLNFVMILSILCSSLYGMSDELHQYFVPHRNSDVLDVLADIIGSICGVYLYQSLRLKNQTD